MKKQPCWAWYLYCTLFQVCQSTLWFSLTLMHINRDYWVDFWISTVRLQIKGINKNGFRYLHLSPDFQELHKAELAASLWKPVVLVTASPSILSGVLWKTLLDDVHKGVKIAGTSFPANFSRKGSVFLLCSCICWASPSSWVHKWLHSFLQPRDLTSLFFVFESTEEAAVSWDFVKLYFTVCYSPVNLRKCLSLSLVSA